MGTGMIDDDTAQDANAAEPAALAEFSHVNRWVSTEGRMAARIKVDRGTRPGGDPGTLSFVATSASCSAAGDTRRRLS